MARAYSLDLRERVVGAYRAEGDCRKIGKRFGVAASAVVKWDHRARQLGRPVAKKMGGHRRFAAARERDWLLERLALKPDITLRELVEELAERGLKVSVFAVWNLLRREGVSFKKKSARQRARPARRSPSSRSVAALPEED